MPRNKILLQALFRRKHTWIHSSKMPENRGFGFQNRVFGFTNQVFFIEESSFCCFWSEMSSFWLILWFIAISWCQKSQMLERLFKNRVNAVWNGVFGGKSSFWIQTVLLKPELPADIDLTSKQHLYKTQNFVKTTFNDMQFNHIFTAKTKHCEIDLVMAIERVKKCFHGT